MASSFLRFLDHTQRRITVGRTPLDEWSARRRDLYLTTHNTHNRQTSMPPVGFEPTISAGERPQIYDLRTFKSCYMNFTYQGHEHETIRQQVWILSQTVARHCHYHKHCHATAITEAITVRVVCHYSSTPRMCGCVGAETTNFVSVQWN